MHHIATTPFGRRPLSRAMLGAQAAAKACPQDAIASKWQVFRDLTEAKHRLGLSDRSLAVLSALLSFHPDVTLTPGAAGLVVFPSNRELSLRAHGIAPTTLRRALAHLAEAGLLIRRDSPNGKRYARKGEGGRIEQAFGFDLTPLVARASEFAGLAAAERAEARARQLLREEISLHRRDLAKTIEAAFAEALPGPWPSFADRLRAAGPMPARSAERPVLEAAAAELRDLRRLVEKCLDDHAEAQKMDANESRNGCHQQTSNSEAPLESEPGFRGSRAEPEERTREPSARPGAARSYPLGLVLQACPDIVDYARHGISSWRDLASTAALVRSMLGISPSAWEEAVDAMGEEHAAITVAAILQKAEAVRSPGGYLRNLTERARAGQFSLGPVLMALLRSQDGVRRQRA